ncbi:MAG: phosphoglycerate dehydrogenase [Chloroflexi bacterium]|nr:phosphoglycerate dehydrogenase [Chloroflexota bacterium]
MVRILVSDPIAEEGIAVLQERADVDVRLGLKPEQLLDVIHSYQALVVRSETKVTSPVVDAGENLRVIGRAGVGVDNIDVEAATRRGIVVVNAPTAVTVAASEHTVALMLALARHIPRANESLAAGEWQRSRFVGVEVRGKILGLVGLGNIGTEVARMALGLHMRVVGYDPFVSPEYASKLGVDLLSLEDLLKTADFISVHVPLIPSTRGLIGSRELSLVKPTARLINCARGGLVDEDALRVALDEGRLAGAALDVFALEPPTGSPLLSCPKVIATPHLGASTQEAQITAAVEVARQVLAVLADQPATYAVNAPRIRPETMELLAPYCDLAQKLGQLFAQLSESQVGTVEIIYNGEIAEYDAAPVKAALVKGLLESVCEEPVNLVNALVLAKARGIRIVEGKSTDPVESYTSLVTLRVPSTTGVSELAGTVVRGRPHIVRINRHWVDVVPTGGYLLFTDHYDRPGVIGKVATLLGAAGINISFIQASRSAPQAEQMMILGVDEPIADEVYDQILAVAEIRAARVVKL